MTKPWTREDTQHWIAQLEHRLEDIEYYLQETIKWCEDNDVYGDQQVFACMIMTVLWVSHMRGEALSKREAYEILGIQDWYKAPEEEFGLDDRYKGWDLDDLLRAVSERFS